MPWEDQHQAKESSAWLWAKCATWKDRSSREGGGFRWAWQTSLLGLQEKKPVCLGQERLHRQKSKARRGHVTMAQACDVSIHETVKTVKSLAHWGRSWDTSNSFAPWQAYLTHTAAGAIGVGEEQPWDTLLQRLVLVTSLKCCAAAGLRRLLTVASLWNSALYVTRFSFPALIHIKALQSRHKIHIVTISSESRDATLDVQ